jgi:dTDP-4-dehydrorhamnose reductase
MKLIIGGSGYIGRNLFEYFLGKNEPVTATYHNSKRENMIYFDLENPKLDNLGIDFKKIDSAFICSAITHPDECKRNEKSSYELNVRSTRNIIKQLWQFNILPVWFSSEYVFNGEKGNYKESDEKNPNTVYGHHKKAIEDFLCNSKKDFLIVRLSKVFGLEAEDRTLLTSIVKQLKNHEEIRCATDQIFSPTYIKDLSRVLDLAIEKRLRGIYNIASSEYFSRYRIAKMIKSQLRIKSGKIIPCSIKNFNFLDSRPLNTSLNVEKIIQATGFKFTPIRESISLLEKMIR